MPSRRCLPTLLPATGVPCCWRQRLPSSTCAVMMRRKPAFRWASITRRPRRGFARFGSFWATGAVSSTTCSARCCFRTWSRVSMMSTCSRFRAARARCACLRVWPAMCCQVWRGQLPSDAVATIAGLSQKAMPRLVCSSFCVPTRAVWTVEIWSSPARRLTLWPALWPIICRRAPVPSVYAASRRLRTVCSSCCLLWRTVGERSSCCLLASRRRCARNLPRHLMPAVCCLRSRRWGRTPSRLMPLVELPLSLPLLRSRAPTPALMLMRTQLMIW